jgi:hypothetical protein
MFFILAVSTEDNDMQSDGGVEYREKVGKRSWTLRDGKNRRKERFK